MSKLDVLFWLRARVWQTSVYKRRLSVMAYSWSTESLDWSSCVTFNQRENTSWRRFACVGRLSASRKPWSLYTIVSSTYDASLRAAFLSRRIDVGCAKKSEIHETT